MFATRKLILVLLMAVSLLFSFSVTPSIIALAAEPQITPSGKALGNMLDSMRVEELWLAGHHINWKTGSARWATLLEKGRSHPLQCLRRGRCLPIGHLHTPTSGTFADPPGKCSGGLAPSRGKFSGMARRGVGARGPKTGQRRFSCRSGIQDPQSREIGSHCCCEARRQKQRNAPGRRSTSNPGVNAQLLKHDPSKRLQVSSRSIRARRNRFLCSHHTSRSSR